MKFNQNQKVKFIGLTIKIFGSVALVSLLGFLLYKLSVADK
jgi:hypothetical protein